MPAQFTSAPMADYPKLTASAVADIALATLYERLDNPRSVFSCIHVDETERSGYGSLNDRIRTDRDVDVRLDQISDVTFAVTSDDIRQDVGAFGDNVLSPAIDALAEKINRDILTKRGFNPHDPRVIGVELSSIVDDKFVFASAPLEVPPFAYDGANVTHHGLSLRVVFGYDIAYKRSQISIDVLYGIRDVA